MILDMRVLEGSGLRWEQADGGAPLEELLDPVDQVLV